MKKSVIIAVATLSFLLAPVSSVKAETVSYTEKKHEQVLDTVSRYTTLHYSSKVAIKHLEPVFNTEVTLDTIVDTETNRIKVKGVLSGMFRAKFQYVYDLKNDRMYVISTTTELSAEQAKADFAKEGVVKGASLRDIVTQMLKKAEIGNERNEETKALTGKKKGNREIYGVKVERGSDDFKTKVSATYRIKKVKGGYLPEKSVAKISAKTGSLEKKTFSRLTFKKFSNDRVTLPKK